MIERKLSSTSFERGSFRRLLDRHLHQSGASEQGRERIENALRAGVEHIEGKHGLQYGVGGKHMDAMEHFLKNHYEEKHLLKPKDFHVIKAVYNEHYGATPSSAANDSEFKKAA